jgi:SAM-dependent methyltransferase
MRYALLDSLACPYCHVELACHSHLEIPSSIVGGVYGGGTRVPRGPGLGPAPGGVSTPLGALLRRYGGRAADSTRTFEVEVEEGLLICGQCARWYPIVGQLPELLPDHLRDARRDSDLFQTFAADLPHDVRAACEKFVPGGAAADDDGAHHKAAEIAITRKVDDARFFDPGYSCPFSPADTHFTLYLLHLFGVVAPLLEASRGDAVLDSGPGYAWTTEWLYRSGINAIGVDICRVYLEIAIKRIGPARPHLVVGDVEHLPIGDGRVRAVLAFESFHHIPDRPRALRGYSRVLADGGRLVLAEPGAEHERAERSVKAMEELGILEKGMELADVGAYAAGTAFAQPEQIFYMRATQHDLPNRVVEVARRNSPIVGNIFLLRKPAQGTLSSAPPSQTSPTTTTTPHTTNTMDATHFDAHYFAHCCGRPYKRDEEWLRFFGTIADRIVADIAPRRVLDAGCAIGLLVETLRRRGVDAEGLDVSDYAIQQAHESVRPHCRVGSVVQELEGRYDLITCIEVLEHVPPAEAEAAVANFCRHTDDILFSSSPTDYGEATHVNVHPPEHWAGMFARHGFIRDLEFDASFITAWAVRFRRRAETLTRVIRDYERSLARTAMERNELRAQVVRFDREIMIAAAETPQLREQLATVNRQLLQTQHQLNQARDRIVHMERSAFWRLRNLWASVRSLFAPGDPADK